MTTNRSFLRRALPGVLATALLISCGASGGTSKDATKLSKSELRKALPNATEVGGDYKADKSNDDTSDPASDAAFDKACPEIKKLGLDDKKDDSDQVKADFITKDGRSINTSFDPSPDNFETDQLDTIIGAINKCDTVRYTDKDGTKVELDLSAKRDDSRGDAGIRFKLQARGDAGQVSFTIDSEGLIFSLDGIGVQVLTQGSVDETDLSSIDPDTDKIDELADTMTEGIRAAEG